MKKPTDSILKSVVKVGPSQRAIEFGKYNAIWCCYTFNRCSNNVILFKKPNKYFKNKSITVTVPSYAHARNKMRRQKIMDKRLKYESNSSYVDFNSRTLRALNLHFDTRRCLCTTVKDDLTPNCSSRCITLSIGSDRYREIVPISTQFKLNSKFQMNNKLNISLAVAESIRSRSATAISPQHSMVSVEEKVEDVSEHMNSLNFFK